MEPLSELLERFRRGPDLVAAVITGAAGAELDFVPSPEKWSIRFTCNFVRASDAFIHAGLDAMKTLRRPKPNG